MIMMWYIDPTFLAGHIKVSFIKASAPQLV